MLFIIQFQEDKQETSKGDYAISGKAQAWMPPYVSTSKLSCRRRTGVSNFIFNFQRNPLTCCTSHTYPITCSNRSKTFPLSRHDTDPVQLAQGVSSPPVACRSFRPVAGAGKIRSSVSQLITGWTDGAHY